MKKVFKEFKCKRCGKCCFNHYILLKIELIEWYKILKFIDSNYDGVIEIMDDSDEFKMITTEEIKQVIELYWNDGSFYDLDIFWTLDSGVCPFIKKNRDGEHYCEIQTIKPKICRNYRCNLENDDFQFYLEQLEKGSE